MIPALMIVIGIFVAVELVLILLGLWLIFKISFLEFKIKLAQDNFYRVVRIARSSVKGLKKVGPMIESVLLLPRFGLKGQIAYYLLQAIPSPKPKI